MKLGGSSTALQNKALKILREIDEFTFLGESLLALRCELERIFDHHDRLGHAGSELLPCFHLFEMPVSPVKKFTIALSVKPDVLRRRPERLLEVKTHVLQARTVHRPVIPQALRVCVRAVHIEIMRVAEIELRTVLGDILRRDERQHGRGRQHARVDVVVVDRRA